MKNQQLFILKFLVTIIIDIEKVNDQKGLTLSSEISYRMEYSTIYNILLMTQVVVEEQLELVNIVEIVQSSLTRNFTLLQRRLNHHDAIISQNESRNLQREHTHAELIRKLQQRFDEQNTLILGKLESLFGKVETLEGCNRSLKQELDVEGIGLKRLNDELFNTQLQFEEKIKVKQQQLEVITQHIRLLALQQGRLNDQVNKKENRVEAERIIKETEILKDKNNLIETQLKMANHKIEKIEILNQKAERLQAKKELQIFKEIQDRVKKELKGSASSPQNRISVKQGGAQSTLESNAKLEMAGRKSSIVAQEKDFTHLMGTTSNVQAILEKWGDKIRSFEVQLREVSENLKILNKQSNGSGRKDFKQNKDNSSQQMKEKINQIKPQIVKLWAKLDTIEDRLSFNQRKLEEKLRSVSDLTSLIKENNVSRLEEKLKNMQTEVFTNLKELKAKLDTKVNVTDYDKYCQNLDERLQQINELIYLKSDKLQVKKALLFLQSKIKEIILVISEDQQNEKDALLTKKQLKCISCDKELDKFSGVVTSSKGNWDGLPFKDHPPEILGRFGMTNFGSLSKKLKKLEGKDLPILNKRSVNQSFQNSC